MARNENEPACIQNDQQRQYCSQQEDEMANNRKKRNTNQKPEEAKTQAPVTEEAEEVTPVRESKAEPKAESSAKSSADREKQRKEDRQNLLLLIGVVAFLALRVEHARRVSVPYTVRGFCRYEVSAEGNRGRGNYRPRAARRHRPSRYPARDSPASPGSRSAPHHRCRDQSADALPP